jgi:hypothetical protein
MSQGALGRSPVWAAKSGCPTYDQLFRASGAARLAHQASLHSPASPPVSPAFYTSKVLLLTPYHAEAFVSSPEHVVE